MHSPVAWDTICAVCSPAAALILATIILAPSVAMARAVARPMPVPAPVRHSHVNVWAGSMLPATSR